MQAANQGRHAYYTRSNWAGFMPGRKASRSAGVSPAGARAFLSGIDIALWDVAGKILDLPIYKLMGGPRRDAVEMYSHGDILKDMGSLDSCREWAKWNRNQPEGFKTFKMEPLQALRGEHVGPEISSAQLRRKPARARRPRRGKHGRGQAAAHQELDVSPPGRSGPRSRDRFRIPARPCAAGRRLGVIWIRNQLPLLVKELNRCQGSGTCVSAGGGRKR